MGINVKISEECLRKLTEDREVLLAACKGMIAHLGPNGYIPSCGEPKTRAVREAIAKAENN